MPANAFSAPGPYCIAKTPAGLPFMTREQPSAMCTPTRSWRQITGRSPPATAASIIGVVGKQNIVLMPSRFRISVIASMTSISVAPLLSSMPETLPPPRPIHQPAPFPICRVPAMFSLLLQGICSQSRTAGAENSRFVPNASCGYNRLVQKKGASHHCGPTEPENPEVVCPRSENSLQCRPHTSRRASRNA